MHTGIFAFHYETNNVFTLTGLHVHQCVPLTLLSELHTACCFQLSSYTELLAVFFCVFAHTSHRHQSSALTPPHLHPGSDVCSACKIRGDINMEWTTKTQQGSTLRNYSLLDKVETNGCNTSCDTSDLLLTKTQSQKMFINDPFSMTKTGRWWAKEMYVLFSVTRKDGTKMLVMGCWTIKAHDIFPQLCI